MPDAPEPDWARVLFGDTSAVEVIGWILAFAVLMTLLVKLWPVLSRFVRTVNSITQLPEFIDRTDATLKAQDALIVEMHHELSYNNETSLKDALLRTELGQKASVAQAQALAESVDQLRADLEISRNPKPKE